MSDDILRQILSQVRAARMTPSTGLRLRERAVEASVDHVLSDRRFDDVQVFVNNVETLRAALDKTELQGVVAEFGVFRGKTLTVIAQHFAQQRVHGFDSFIGLPEQWGAKSKGDFSIGGTPPDLPVKNVQFHVGFFDATVPKFAGNENGPFSFVHLDADLYSSTKTVFDELRDWFVPGTVIVFDEYFGYHGWERHEHRAFQEFLDATGLSFEGLGVGHMNLAVRLTAG